jgi:hypothetical protein
MTKTSIHRTRTRSGLPVTTGEFGPKCRTRYPSLMYQHRIDHWRILDCTEPTWTAGVGPIYRSKAELLADLDRYAEANGHS